MKAKACNSQGPELRGKGHLAGLKVPLDVKLAKATASITPRLMWHTYQQHIVKTEHDCN